MESILEDRRYTYSFQMRKREENFVQWAPPGHSSYLFYNVYIWRTAMLYNYHWIIVGGQIQHPPTEVLQQYKPQTPLALIASQQGLKHCFQAKHFVSWRKLAIVCELSRKASPILSQYYDRCVCRRHSLYQHFYIDNTRLNHGTTVGLELVRHMS